MGSRSRTRFVLIKARPLTYGPWESVHRLKESFLSFKSNIGMIVNIISHVLEIKNNYLKCCAPPLPIRQWFYLFANPKDSCFVSSIHSPQLKLITVFTHEVWDLITLVQVHLETKISTSSPCYKMYYFYNHNLGALPPKWEILGSAIGF